MGDDGEIGYVLIKLVWAIPLCQEGERGVSREL
jgi:hypothetical protein